MPREELLECVIRVMRIIYIPLYRLCPPGHLGACEKNFPCPPGNLLRSKTCIRAKKWPFLSRLAGAWRVYRSNLYTPVYAVSAKAPGYLRKTDLVPQEIF